MRVLPLALAAALFSGVTAIVIYLSGLSSYGGAGISEADLAALAALQGRFSKCVDANGLGLEVVRGEDYCRVEIRYPSDTVSKWIDPKTGKAEGLSFEFNLCEAVASWEQVRNSTTILTKEYIDALPNGWEEYAWRRINKGILLNKCKNRTLCMEKLSLVLPETSPYVPRHFEKMAHPSRITLNMLVQRAAKALDKVVELDETKKEVLIVKTTIHDIMNRMIQELPISNPVYLMLGTSFGSSAKGTGLKALEFALSICDSVDMYGFTVDPGYKEWTSHVQLVKIHSPMRGDPGRVVKWLPSKDTIEAARVASEKLLKRPGAGSDGPLGSCNMIKKRKRGKTPKRSGLRDAAVKHLEYMKGATRYPMERNVGGGYMCMINDR
ncbi:hypothetical protein QOZ80_2BG0152840 [Eleusine coracana subsp. coracana]|nr:hypothetical protein QOZ80_2BG0152840 [Eleusine coracana subsp. coracana]